MPSSCEARTTRRSASTPRRWPSARGRPRAAAQRPLPSMMIATCKGGSVRSGPSVAGAAAFDIDQSLNGEDFFFLGRKQLIDFGDRPVGRLLYVIGQTFLIVLGNLVVLLKLLDGIEAIRKLEKNQEISEDDQERSEEHTSELQSPDHLVCRLLLEKKK